MAEARLASLGILQAATQGSARAVERASAVGTVEPSKRANSRVLDADPTSDIRKSWAFIAWFGKV